MESSDSDATDEWIDLGGDDDEDDLKKISHEDHVNGCIECHDSCDPSDERTTSLQFVEDGNPPGNDDAPPAEEVLMEHDNVQDFVDQIEDLSDLSSWIKDELPGDVDITPTIRHYVHNKNAYLNSLLNIYLILAVTAAIALGFGNFLGWSNCGSLKENVCKQEQMLGGLQNKLNDCISLLNVSSLLSASTRSAKNSEVIEFQEKDTGEHDAFLGQKNLKNFIPYPFPTTKSRSELSYLFKKFDKNDQINVQKDILYARIIRSNKELLNFEDSSKHVTESQEGKGNIEEFVTSKPIEFRSPSFDLYSVERPTINLDSKRHKETLISADIINAKWEESLFNLKSKLNVHELSVDKHSGDMTTVLGMQDFDMTLPQKESLESQNTYYSSSPLVVDRLHKLKTSKVVLDFGVRNHELNHNFADLTREYSHKSSIHKSDSNYITSVIYSVYNMISLHQKKNIKEGSYERDLNVTHFVFQVMLENLGKKLEDIKNFTLSPLFMKHSYHGQKAVKELLKAFINFVDKLLKHSDMFVQKNIHDDYKMNKLFEQIQSNMNKLDYRWQEIKNKWHQIIQHEQNAEHMKFEENFYFSPFSKKKFEPQNCKQDKSFNHRATKGYKKNRFVDERLKEQKKNKSKHNKEKRYKNKPVLEKNIKTENAKYSSCKFIEKDMKEKRYNPRFQESEEKLKMSIWKAEQERRNSITKSHKDKIPDKRNRFSNMKGKENNYYVKQHQKY